MNFFDFNCWLGAPVYESITKIPETVDDLLDLMDYSVIEKAVVTSCLIQPIAMAYID